MEDHTFAADTLVEEREVVMHTHSGGNPTLRNAHFLKPISSQDHTHLPTPPRSVLPSKPTSQNLKNWTLNTYKKSSSEKLKIWVDSLKPKYQEIWKKSGIYEAILASTYKVPRNKDLIFGLAERWCDETNTFVFSWGEVTITLEDVMFLGGYSVLGALYLTPIPDECVDIFDSLKNAYRQVKLVYGGHASSSKWMEYFMCSGKDLEHEAFLAVWLSRFVIPCSNDDIIIRDFNVAIHLSRGNRIALAPVVLANIYMDMRLLHNSIVESKVSFLICRFDLLQMWAWERFPKLRRTPSVMEKTEPRSARWNRVKILDVRTVLDSAKESFVWRPYVITSSNCMLSKLYGDDGRWVVVESDDTESLARCLRVSELIGLGYIEQYLPHRVAMQFGLDQDVPAHVIRSNESPKTAWSSYNRSFRGTKLYIPPQNFESAVSSRYVVWWRGLLAVNEDVVTTCIQNKKRLPLISWGHKRSRSRKTLLKTSKCYRKRIDLDDMLELKTHSGPEPSAKRFCMTDPVISCVRSRPSSDKSKERKSSAERSVNLNKDVAVNNANHAEANNVNIENGNDEVGSKPEGDIVYIKEEGCDNSTSESPHLELMARILRLEVIVDAIKAAKS